MTRGRFVPLLATFLVGGLTALQSRIHSAISRESGTSIDQHYAQKFGQETPIPSMQLCIENVDQAGGCSYNYSCVYTDTISWASPSEPGVFRVYEEWSSPDAMGLHMASDHMATFLVGMGGLTVTGTELYQHEVAESSRLM